MPAPKKSRQSRGKRNTTPASSRVEHDDSIAVTALIDAIVHPLKPTLETMRETILSADPAITEGVKWNSPSFYCHGWFVTISSRKLTQLDVVLHHGAKIRADSSIRVEIDDPKRLLTWPSSDRAVLSFASDADFRSNLRSFQRIIQQWAAYQKRSAGAT
jgi:hypothetical protein